MCLIGRKYLAPRSRLRTLYEVSPSGLVWRVFSLVAFLVPLPIGLLGLWMCHQLLYGSSGNKMSRASMDAMNLCKGIMFSVCPVLCVFSGTLRYPILMSISLRALPAGSYTTVE